MKKPHHLEPPPERSGEPSKTRESADPRAEPKQISLPAAQAGITPRTFRIASLVLAAGAAMIPAGLKYFTERKPSEIPVYAQEMVPVHSIKFHESGVIRSKPLRAERSGFKKSFSNGNTEFPAYKIERSYAVYDPVGERFLGTLTVPDSSCTDPILIELDQPSAFWRPALKVAGTNPSDGTTAQSMWRHRK